MSRWSVPTLTHLATLADGFGIREHAIRARPHPGTGSCTDDAGRALAVVTDCWTDPWAEPLAVRALAHLARAQLDDGTFRLRTRPDGSWTDHEPSDDATGRALLGLGVAAARAPWPEVKAGARRLFDAGTGFRSPHPRARAYAALGATAILHTVPRHEGARSLAAEAAGLLDDVDPRAPWPWPEARLTYDNARLPEAVLAVAGPLGRPELADRAVTVLAWLVATESIDGRFSFTPVGGRGPGDPKPAFDQQPIEAWAMAEACTRAHRWTGDRRWRARALSAARWFLGENDAGVPLVDIRTGGGHDGLEPTGVNRNEGAESTLAWVAAMACVGRLGTVQGAGRPAEDRVSSR